MTIYDELQKVAANLITEFKQGESSLIRITPGTGPRHNPGPSTPTVIPLSGAVVRGVSEKYVRGSLAQATDLQTTIPGNVKPELSDFFENDGRRYKIMRILPKPAAGTPVAFVLILEGPQNE